MALLLKRYSIHHCRILLAWAWKNIGVFDCSMFLTLVLLDSIVSICCGDILNFSQLFLLISDDKYRIRNTHKFSNV